MVGFFHYTGITLFLMTINVGVVKSYNDCGDVTLPQCTPRRDDRAAYRTRSELPRGKRHFGSSIRSVLEETFQSCGGGCIQLKNVGYLICDTMPTCAVEGDNKKAETTTLLLTTRNTTTTDVTTQPTSGTVVGKHKSCNGWGIGMLVLGMFLGLFLMAVVCIFVPSLHSKFTRKLKRSVSKKGKSTVVIQSNPNYERSTPHQIIANVQDSEPAMYLELDQPTNTPEYQTLSRYDRQAGDAYTPLDVPEQNLYNAIEDENVDKCERKQGPGTFQKSTVIDNAKISNKTDLGENVSTKYGKIYRSNMAGRSEVQDANQPGMGANYFILEPVTRTDTLNEINVKSLGDDQCLDKPSQPEYFILESNT